MENDKIRWMAAALTLAYRHEGALVPLPLQEAALAELRPYIFTETGLRKTMEERVAYGAFAVATLSEALGVPAPQQQENEHVE